MTNKMDPKEDKMNKDTKIKMVELRENNDTNINPHLIMTNEKNEVNASKFSNSDKHNKVMPEEEEKEYNLENVLSEFKLSGPYHLKFIFLITLLAIFSAEQNLNYIFSTDDSDYRCKQSNCETSGLLILEQNSSLDYKCLKYDIFHRNDTCIVENLNISHATVCSEWDYDEPRSFLAEFNLGCEDWKRTLVGTMHSVGFMIGLILAGPLSDKIGRKKLLIINVTMTSFCGVIKSFITSYWLFVVFETVEPMFEFYSITFTLVIEMVTKDHRAHIIAILGTCTTMGQVLLAAIGYSTSSWRVYMKIIYAPPLFLIIVYVFWMDESLRWLLIKGKKSEAQEIIRRAAKNNKIRIEEAKIVNIKWEHSASASVTTAIKMTLTSKKLFLRFIICVCMWFTSTFDMYVLFLNSASLGGNKYLDHSLVALCSSVGAVILYFLLTKFKKKGPLIFAFTLTGVFCMAESFLPKEFVWLSTLLYLAGKVNASICLRISFLWSTELFPTYTRNTMLGLCSSLGRTATILAPQTPLLVAYWSRMPSFLVGILSLMTASVVTLMPDTADSELPDNVQQAEALGDDDKEKEADSKL